MKKLLALVLALALLTVAAAFAENSEEPDMLLRDAAVYGDHDRIRISGMTEKSRADRYGIRIEVRHIPNTDCDCHGRNSFHF